MDWSWFSSIWHTLCPPKRRRAAPRRLSSSENMSWHIDEHNNLIINGRHYDSLFPWTKAYFERAFARLQNKISETGWPVSIVGLAIEEHVAESLWRHGDLRREDIEQARLEPEKITFRIRLSGQEIDVCLVTTTYYSDYDFIVTGHPQGYVRVRDLPDPLALIAHEQVF